MSAGAAMIENRTFDELAVGDSAELTRTLRTRDIELFATASGDANPLHLDPAFAADGAFGRVVAHGMWTASLISALLGTRLPGPGTVYLGQDLRFLKPVGVGDTVTVRVTVTEKIADGRRVRLDCVCLDERGERVVAGSAEVRAPERKIVHEAPDLPDVRILRHDRYDRLIESAQKLPPIRVAVVHPCDAGAIEAVVQAREERLIEPVLIGPEHKVRRAADAAGFDLGGVEFEPVAHSHAAAARAVELARERRVDAVMKGSLHTDELLGAVVAREGGLRTDRRVSHVYVMDVPAYPRPLLVTDAAVNIAPDLADKRDICQNAIDLARLLGIETPRVAVLSAVETVNPRMQATLDAAALSVMALRGQITGGIVEGPFAFDNAIDPDAARTKGLNSEVAGRADILLVPDIEAGNMVAKQLLYFGGADGAGIVLGAQVPIILTSRADAVRVRIASVALASLVVAAMREREAKLAAGEE